MYAQSPLSKFSATATGTNTVSFSNTSSGNPNSILWEFTAGNPSTSTDPNPSVSYSASGIYTAKLTVNNSSGSSVSTRTIKITSRNIIDLCTAKNNDGTLMADTEPDPDWLYTDTNGVVSTPVTRYTFSGWSSASTGNVVGISRWITGNNAITGYHEYKSKEFEIPAGVTIATLNLRSLSFVRNWTYLVKKNTDGSETETQITLTTYMSDGAKGWLNSRSPEVVDYPLPPGKYYIKVKAYTNNGSQRQAIDVNANVNFGNAITISPAAEFSASPLSTFVGSNVQFTNLSQGTPASLSWTFEDGTSNLTSVQINPAITFSTVGHHYANLSLDYNDNLISTLRVNNYIETLADQDWTRAPNSYVFDTEYAGTNNKGGIDIPIKKAYKIWSDSNWYLNQNIPSGSQNASIYWQDVPGLIKSATIIPGATPEESIIRVMVDRSKGEGNAVISFKVNDMIYWSWHVWVTDDPSKTPTSYDKGIEKDFVGNDATIQYLDRNLGATNASFLGNDWHKSGGLLYQWGRKDPFPGFIYKDGTWYEVSGDVGNIRGDDGHNSGANGYPYAQVLAQKLRAYDNIGDNIKDAVKNPMTFINDPQKPWFSSTVLPQSGYRWNLWSDNRAGQDGGSPFDTSGNTQKIKLKSPYDPCPNGWRVPSFMGNIAVDNTASPWGRHGGSNDDGTPNKTISNTTSNSFYDGIKIYPNLGVDFSQTTWSNAGVNRKSLGQFPLNGDYEFYAANVNKSIFQDTGSEMNIRSATLAGLSGADAGIVADRAMVITSDFGRNYDKDPDYGLNEIRTQWNYNLANMGVAVRCMKDPDNSLIVNNSPTYNFPTNYVGVTDVEYKTGLNNPNSYVVPMNTEQNTLVIPITKPFAVYNQHLTDHQVLSSDNLRADVLWTSDKNLIRNVELIDLPNCNSSDPLVCRKISVNINPNIPGNAVITLKRDGGENTRKSFIYWSWHIWVPNGDPTASTITYQTESLLTNNSTSYFVNPTHSGSTPLKTTFMDRNLGAIEAFPTVANPSDLTPLELASIKNSAGLQYQWGRKDPLPSFRNPGEKGMNRENKIYVTSEGAYTNGGYSMNTYTDVDENYYNTNYNISGLANAAYISNDIDHNSKFGIKPAIESVLLKSVQNPLSILTNSGTKDWVFAKDSYASDRWGHGTSKSVFDPCPEGWRVPDVLSNESDGYLKKVKDGSGSWIAGHPSNSLWYYGDTGTVNNYGVPQRAIDLTGVYSGIIAYSSASHLSGDPVYGYMFNNPNYKIGNFPSTGIRNKDGNNSIFSSDIATDVWTAALSARSTGLALALQIGHTNDYIHNRRINTLSSGNTGVDNAIPQAAANVRCVKDVPRYDGTIPATPTTGKQINQSKAVEKIVVPILSETKLYPNPVKDILYISTDKNTTYKIYDMAGVLVQSGKFVDKHINVSNLKEGIYMIRLNDETTFKIIKQ